MSSTKTARSIASCSQDVFPEEKQHTTLPQLLVPLAPFDLLNILYRFPNYQPFVWRGSKANPGLWK